MKKDTTDKLKYKEKVQKESESKIKITPKNFMNLNKLFDKKKTLQINPPLAISHQKIT